MTILNKVRKFYWEDSQHFINTACKAIRDYHGKEYVTNKLIAFFHNLYEWEQANFDFFNSDGYYFPSGQIVNKIKNARTIPHLHSVITDFQKRLHTNDTLSFYVNCGLPVAVVDDEGTAKYISYDEYKFNQKDTYFNRENEPITSLDKMPGIYFLYCSDKRLLYIGKSRNLAARILSSAGERRATYVRYIMAKTEADIHILEPYLITTLKPPLNSECKTKDIPSFIIEVPPLSDFIKLTN